MRKGPSTCGIALAFALDGVLMLWMRQEIGWDRRYSIFGPTPIDCREENRGGK